MAKRRQMPTGMGSNMDTPAALAAASMLAAGGAAPGGYGEKLLKDMICFEGGIIFLVLFVVSHSITSFLYTL